MRIAHAAAIASCLIATALGGCIPHKQYRTEYQQCEFGGSGPSCERNALQTHSNADGSSYLLGFIEFDDQGQLWDRQQMDTVLKVIAEETASKELLMVVFAHGWKHSAAPGDGNIETFRKALANLSAADAKVAEKSGSQPRRVVGVYLGWRGGSVSLPVVKELTFWERKNTAQKVGHGAVTEVLSRLELIKQTKNQMEGDADTRLVVVGHSFGGAVTYAALGQLLANRFVHTTGPIGVQSTVTGYGDLVVLINPAFEAMLFSSLSDMSFERGSYFEHQLPVVAVLTSKADDATRIAFPMGRRLSTLLEKEHDMQRLNATTKVTETIDGGLANVTAVGHFEPYRTHELYPSDARTRSEVAPAQAEQAARTFLQTSTDWSNDKPGSKIDFGGLTLERSHSSAGRDPYIVAYVDKEIINDHNDIDDPRLIQFIEQLILISTQSSQQLQRTLEGKSEISERE